MLRTVALWERNRIVIASLGTLCVAHWALLYRTMFIVKAAWEPAQGTCVVIATNPSLLNVTFFFTMGFDLIPAATITYGFTWVLMSIAAHFLPLSSIAACRAVIRLLEFSTGDVYVHSMSNIASTHPIRHSIAPYSPRTPKYALSRPEVRVTTEHITMAEFS
ncbi:hypothetical protein H0H93_000434 [Arthromyces matolae]|nr:hypothetical protein H0H93_000434 [Arthromyces matolae]